MKPLTQTEIDAVPMMEGWKIDGIGGLTFPNPSLPIVYHPDTEIYKSITRLVRACLANRLEAAPQPPVEQSEPAHPLHAGYIDGREVRRVQFVDREESQEHNCPFCFCTLRYNDRVDNHYCPNVAVCEAENIAHGKFWLAPAAPPAVIEPEPELDEFEQWIQDMHLDRSIALSDRYLTGLNDALEKYREIISRKGDK